MFITFEGPDGSGKTTQIEKFHQYLLASGYEVVKTREPGGTDIGQKIRGIILDPENKEMDARTEILLYLASRAQHVSQKILPALNSGKVVLCDRFADSSVAYQGAGRKLDVADIVELNKFATQGKEPDITFLLDGDVEVLLSRVGNRGVKDRLEQEKLDFHQRLRSGYLTIAKGNPNRVFVVNAIQDENIIFEQIVEIFSQFISK